jgi:hypothetical protein
MSCTIICGEKRCFFTTKYGIGYHNNRHVIATKNDYITYMKTSYIRMSQRNMYDMEKVWCESDDLYQNIWRKPSSIIYHIHGCNRALYLMLSRFGMIVMVRA